MPDLPQTSPDERFATAFRGAEGGEDAGAFVEKRKPSWLMQVEWGA
ncbi:MAG: hypothetical protein ABSE67_13015 [Xanthobacteraceae bacterium]|jgi:hypothetical protein